MTRRQIRCRGEQKIHASFRIAAESSFRFFLPWHPLRLLKCLTGANKWRSWATWRSGYAAVCKTVYTSSILVVASTFPSSAEASGGDISSFAMPGRFVIRGPHC